MDTYLTIKEKAEGIYKEKGSKFIALAYPVTTEDEVKDIIAGLKKEYYDARHHCYAYAIGAKGESFRANDDGEPSGTAGRPIYGQLLSHSVTNVLIVVIRYFGGTKLGVSGLIHAYKTAAADALSNAIIEERTVNDVYRISFAYPVMNDIMKLVKDEDLGLLDQHFDNTCSVSLSIRQSKTDLVLGKIEKIDSAISEYVTTI